MRALFATALAVVVSGCEHDPAPFIWNSRDESRNLECIRLSQAEAHVRYPGKVRDLPPRPYGRPSDALVCSPRYLTVTERPARDEAVLSSLRAELAEIATLASTLTPGDVVWHVDAYYPQQEVAAKISVAAKGELSQRGRKVSDRTPVLAAGDVAVLSRLPQHQQYPLACRRYFDEGTFTTRDVFLGVMLLDARETALHAGVCDNGNWRWLR